MHDVQQTTKLLNIPLKSLLPYHEFIKYEHSKYYNFYTIWFTERSRNKCYDIILTL